MEGKLIVSIDPFRGCSALNIACGSAGDDSPACGSGNSVPISLFVVVVFVIVNLAFLRLEFPVEVTAIVAGEGLERIFSTFATCKRW